MIMMLVLILNQVSVSSTFPKCFLPKSKERGEPERSREREGERKAVEKNGIDGRFVLRIIISAKLQAYGLMEIESGISLACSEINILT